MPRGPFFTHRPGGFGAGFFTGDVRETLQREMNRVFDEVWRNLPGDDESRPSGAASAAPRSFSVDVSETADEVRVRADLPGVAEQDVEVTLDDDRLTIRAERRSGRQSAGERSHVSECSVGRFERTVRVPGPVDPDQVDAEFERGVLTVTLSKPRAASGSGRRIPVRGTSPSPRPTGASEGGSIAGGASGSASASGSITGSTDGFIQGDGALGASPSTGAGAEPQASTDVENAAKPGGAVHGYNE